MKVIDFNLPIKQLADQYDDFVPLMVELGFTKIKIPECSNRLVAW
ncbi:hypothetical protein ACW185_08125 [Limosilactobacillus fermentum]